MLYLNYLLIDIVMGIKNSFFYKFIQLFFINWTKSTGIPSKKPFKAEYKKLFGQQYQ
jgi:hypothetical protein